MFCVRLFCFKQKEAGSEIEMPSLSLFVGLIIQSSERLPPRDVVQQITYLPTGGRDGGDRSNKPLRDDGDDDDGGRNEKYL